MLVIMKNDDSKAIVVNDAKVAALVVYRLHVIHTCLGSTWPEREYAGPAVWGSARTVL